MAPPKGLLQRLDAKLDRSGGVESCHLWLASLSRGAGRETAYPILQESGHRGKFWRVNRLVLLLEDLPEEAFVREAALLRWLRLANQHRQGVEAAHACDNSRCANARHLEWQPHGRNVSEQAARRAKAREAA